MLSFNSGYFLMGHLCVGLALTLLGERAMEAAVSTARPGRLLLVDDEEHILRSLRRVLRQSGWEIETAPDGEAGLHLFERFRPEVVISDFRMPGLNGVDLLSRIKEQAPRVQRILLTGQADQQAIEDAINRAQVFRFIAKPWNDAQLQATAREAFETYHLSAENDRLYALAQTQNSELRTLNSDLEQRVSQRTALLSRAKREWELTFDAIDRPLALVDMEDLTVRRANRAYALAAGRPVTELGVRPKCHQFLFGRAEPCTGCPLTLGALASEGTLELQNKDRTWVLSAYPMGDEPVAVCSYRDVTRERQVTRQLVESEKMVAVGNLAGGVAHEINNPLGGILAFTQLMRREEGRSQKDKESLELIEESALRCKRIVESLLQFSRRPRDDDRRPLDLARCIEDAVILFQAQLKNHPKVQLVQKLEREQQVFGDAGQLGQVALNLLVNALQALPERKGTITVETGRVEREAFFRVADDGVGIAPENLPRIFEPHFTTKPPGEGTGLGLSIAWGIVSDHRGRIEVDSRPGAGARFTTFLPLHVV